MKHLRFLVMAALVAMPLTACDDDNPTEQLITGTISGSVTAEGAGVAGVSVTLVGATSQSATTDAGGSYSFAGVEAGSYGIAISDFPADVSFSTVSKTTSITTTGQVATVDFSGSYIRTASISGNVSASGEGLAAVAVTLSGPEGASNAVTDAAGNYSTSGLRSGDYTVTIEVPVGYIFANNSFDVTVGVGEAQNVSFVGEAEITVDPVTAQVVISSVEYPDGEDVNPNDVDGQIQVNLQVDPGENNLDYIRLVMTDSEGNDVIAGEQDLGAGVAPEFEQLQGNVFTVSFTVVTDEVGADGTPTYLNDDWTLKAVLGLIGAVSNNTTTTMDLTFNNAEDILATLIPEFMDVVDGDYMVGGVVDVLVMPVLFSGKELSWVDVCVPFDCITLEGPFPATATFTYDPDDLGWDDLYWDYAYTSDAEYSDGTIFSPETEAFLEGVDEYEYYWDYEAPTWAGALTLTDQTATGVLGLADAACCGNNWVGPDYPPADGLAADPSDGSGIGVDMVYFTVENLATEEVVQVAEDGTMADAGLAQGLTNDEFQLCAEASDLYGNASGLCMTGAGANAGMYFGYDDTPPFNEDVEGPPAQTSYNSMSTVDQGGITSAASEDRSGFSGVPFRGLMQWWDADDTAYIMAQDEDDGGMVNMPSNIGACAVGQTPSTGAVLCYPDLNSDDGVYYVTGVPNNQAGVNSGDFFEGWVYNDQTPPEMVDNVTLPGQIRIGQSASFTAGVADNLHVGSTAFAFQPTGFPDWIPLGGNIENAAGDTDKWDGAFPTEDVATLTINPAIVGWQRYSDMALFKVAMVRAKHTDLAGNVSVGVGNNIIPTTVDDPETYAGDGITGWAVTAFTADICNGQGGTECDEDDMAPVTVEAVAQGAAGTFANPFLTGEVYFYFWDNMEYTLLGAVPAVNAVITDEGGMGNRYYTWEFDITADMVANYANAATLQIWAVGVKDSYGTGLFTTPQGTLTVIDGTY